MSAVSRPGHPDGWVATSEDLVVGFSGVLDNVVELAAAWIRESPTRGPTTPVDVVAAGIRTVGVDATASRMRGVFAVVASDGRRLWAFRDQLGLHPLAYGEDAAGLFIGVEPKEVVAGSGVAPEPDMEVVTRIFYGSEETDLRCAIAGVSVIPPSTILEATFGGMTFRRYWNPESLLETTRLGPTDLRDAFDRLMTQAVGRCLDGSDVVSLSGGLDSPAVAAFAAPLHAAGSLEPLSALSAVYPDLPSVDETRYIEAVARDLGLQLHTYRPTARPTDGLRKWARLFDAPVPVVGFSQVAEFLHSARELGFRNVLSGEVEEFVFEMRREVLSHLVRHGRFASAWKHARARRALDISWSSMLRRVAYTFTPIKARSMLRRLHRRPSSELPLWLVEGVERFRPPPPPPSWRTDQLAAFGGSGITLSADDMIHELMGVRERRPFADIDLWEFALGLRAEVKHGDPRPKSLIRELLRGRVPSVVLDRRDKTVFDAYIRSNTDYPELRKWLVDPPGPPVSGVRYDLLRRRLEGETMTLHEYMWAKDLASVHAFLSLWENPRTERP